MRIFLIVILVVLFTAANIRIDGVWPPASFSKQAEQVARQAGSPGLIAQALLRELVPRNHELSPMPNAPRALSTPRMAAGGQRDVTPSARECG